MHLNRLLRLIASALALLLLGVAAGSGVTRLAVPVPQITCAVEHGAGEPYNVLVVAESWGAGDRLFPNLTESLAQRMPGRAVRACSMAFSGKNSFKIYRGMKEQAARGVVSGLFGHRAPDTVILLNGVNDQIQHVGAGSYAMDTANIAHLFNSDVSVMELPRIRFTEEAQLPIYLRAKNWIYDHWYDDGRDDVREQYRAALRATHPELKTIGFDGFMPVFNPADFQVDGIHLTQQSFKRYGSFLGSQVPLGLQGSPDRATEASTGEERRRGGG